jgi:hypothetical protein
MFPLFNKNSKKEEPVRLVHDKEKGIVRLEHDGETDGKGNLPLLEEFTKHSDFPIFKGKIDNAYESDFLGYKDKCPLCNTPTVQHYSSFVWANQLASRLLAAPAGHFCPNCPTVIIDDDVVKNGTDRARFIYWGVCAIESGYSETNLFSTLNGEKVTYILNEEGGLDGILNSVHAPSGGTYMSPDNFRELNKTIPNIQALKKKAKNKKKNKQANQSRKANRKK